MKYLRKFNSEADKDAWLAGDEFVTPNVVLTEGKVGYNLERPAMSPLYIDAIEDLTIKFSNTYEYSKDNTTWSSGTSDTTISANAGEKVYFRASGLTPSSSKGIGTFTISNGTCNVAGNIMSMAYGADFVGKIELTNASQFSYLFADATKIKAASNLILPATTLKGSCYKSMFSGCASLVTAPELPATALTSSCYQSMFYGCASLVTAPELPATALTSSCYQSMFYGCASLVTAPELPATTLKGSCYFGMFSGCTSLVTAPELPATTLEDSCYKSMFYGCASLVTAPELPATRLQGSCYQSMFNGCTSLNYIKAMFTTTPGTDYTNTWVNGVSATGTFVKNSAATWDVTGANGIPTGWTVETASA